MSKKLLFLPPLSFSLVTLNGVENTEQVSKSHQIKSNKYLS